MHVRSSDWSVHGHDHDHRYDAVLLHVVYLDDAVAAGRPVATARGAAVPALPLAARLGESAGWAELGQPTEEECRRRGAALDDAELGARLDRLGDERLAEKAAELEADLTLADPEQVGYERLFEVLGYSQNRRPCHELARRLPVAALYGRAHRRPLAERVALCQGLLFGAAGLLPSQRPDVLPLDWEGAREADELERTWAAFGDDWRDEALPAGAWSLAVRPLNHPARRLAAMSHYLGANLPAGLLAPVWSALRSADSGEAVRRLADALTVAAPESYWAAHFDFGRPLGADGRQAAGLVGRERALAAVVNACLPLAVAAGDADLADAARSAYRAAPRLASDEVTRWLIAEVLGPARGRLVSSARRQQGLHRLFRTGCDQCRCDECPLLAG